MYLTLEQEELLSEVPKNLWTNGKNDIGLIQDAAMVKIIPKGTFRPYQRQYPLKPEAEKGIEPVIRELIDKGVIVPCPDSPCNTPLFPVRKASGEWRLVQDLQAVNSAVIPRAPITPDPNTILNDM